MSMTMWSPFDEIRKIENEISNIFRSFEQVDRDNYRRLPVDVEDTGDSYVITSYVPGFTKDDLTIEVNPQYMEIMATREFDETEHNYLRRELWRGNWLRRIAFEKPIVANEGTTTLHNGVLTVTLPIMEEAQAVKLIPEEVEA